GLGLAPAAGGSCLRGDAYNFEDSHGNTITPATSMTYAACGTVCPRTEAGPVTLATEVNSYLAYAGIGFKINQPTSATGPDSSVLSLTPAGSGLTVSFTGTVGTGVILRAEI